MAITIIPGSAKITFLNKPISLTPKISAVRINEAVLSSRELQIQGEVTLNGNAGDSTKDWRVGWIQAQWIETNWAYYRGRSNDDGSIFLQFGRPPARSQQACRDVQDNVNDIFYSTSTFEGYDDINQKITPPALIDSPAGNFPITVQVALFDAPAALFNLTEKNALTNTDNYLREAQVETHFCTILTVRDPNGKFYHQAHFYWNVRAQARFRVAGSSASSLVWTVRPTGLGIGANVGRVFQGAPNDRRFASILTAPQTKNCNDVANDAINSASLPKSANRHESRVWENFDVRKP